LIKSKYPPNEKNFDGVTPLLMTVDDTSDNGVKLAKEILKHNCDQNDQNANGYTALALCVIYDNMDVAKMLVDNGADMYLLIPS